MTVKKILIGGILVISIGVISYFGYVAYAVFSFASGCGMDDGPFEAVLTEQIELTTNAQEFDLSGNGRLVLENRNDTLPPILTLIENDNVQWTLNMDTRNTKGYESTTIWGLSNLTVTKNTDPIKLNFIGHWTYGAESGSMKIDREDGENSFCLSW